MRGYDTPAGRTGRDAARFFGRHPEEQLEEDLARLRRLAERARRAVVVRAHERPPRVVVVERREREGARHALTPRERERERQRERAERERRWETQREAEERRAAGWYLRRGVDRLLEPPPGERRRRPR
jgi:hypothetical protein